jgi:hypothetical protein
MGLMAWVSTRKYEANWLDVDMDRSSPVSFALPRRWNAAAGVHDASQMANNEWIGDMSTIKCCSRRHSTQDNERRNDRVVPAER